MIGLIGTHEIRGQQSSKCRLLLGSFVAERVDVIDVAAGGGLRLLARARGHGFFRFAFYSVRIGKDEAAFVFGAGIEIEKAAGKHVGRDVAVVMPAAVARTAAEHLFVLQPQQREALAPLLLAFLAIGDVDARVAIVVARDFPREAEGDQSGRIDYEFARNGVRLTPDERGEKGEQWKRAQG